MINVLKINCGLLPGGCQKLSDILSNIMSNGKRQLLTLSMTLNTEIKQLMGCHVLLCSFSTIIVLILHCNIVNILTLLCFYSTDIEISMVLQT